MNPAKKLSVLPGGGLSTLHPGGRPKTVVLVMAEGGSYQVTVNGAPVPFLTREGGALEVTLEGPPVSGTVHLSVTQQN